MIQLEQMEKIVSSVQAMFGDVAYHTERKVLIQDTHGKLRSTVASYRHP